MGGLILIDPDTNVPVAGGMISKVSVEEESRASRVTESYRELSERRNGHDALLAVLTGVDSFNLDRFARKLESELVEAGFRTALLNRELFAEVGQSFASGVLQVGPVMVQLGLVTLCVSSESDGVPAEWDGLNSLNPLKIDLNREADIQDAFQRLLNVARPLPGI